MQTTWIKRHPSPSRRVILIALGWAGSPELLEGLSLPGDETGDTTDLVCLWDYRTLDDISDLCKTLRRDYTERHLLAWSFGVWVAQHLFESDEQGNFPVMWDTSTALNGTPLPVDEHYGIPPRAFAVTRRSIRAAGTGKFLERMCGSPGVLKSYYARRSTRPLDEIGEELERLGNYFGEYPAPSMCRIGNLWGRAIVGLDDQIFPPANMIACWRAAGVPVLELPETGHYLFHDPEILCKLLHHEAR